MNKKKQRSAETIAIQSFSKEGFGVGSATRADGTSFQLEVPFTLPGDVVRATPMRPMRGLWRSRLDVLITPSPERQPARCVHFGSCGGCRWQHLDVALQLRLKQERIEQLLAPLIDAQTLLHPIEECSPPWAYRNKMEFSFSQDRQGQRFLGLVMQSGRGHVFNLTECHLVNPWFAQAVQTVRSWWEQSALQAYHPFSDSGSLRTLTVREGWRSGDRLVMLTVSGNPDYALQRPELDRLVEQLVQAVAPTQEGAQLSLFLRIQQIAKGRPTQYYEILLYGADCVRETLFIQARPDQPAEPVHFAIAPTAFFQPNPRQAEKLISRGLQMTSLSSGDTVYDLCCGTGAWGLSAAPLAQDVIGIELSPESALDARTNAQRNQRENIIIHTGDVNEVLRGLRAADKLKPADLVIVDPPRAGLGEAAIQALLSLAPREILSISCNPTSQATNGQQLLAAGYHLAELLAVDQFPQTLHIETAALFIK